jgi:hypothetical protein
LGNQTGDRDPAMEPWRRGVNRGGSSLGEVLEVSALITTKNTAPMAQGTGTRI